MARRTITYTCTNDDRDKDAVFVITEMPASRAEDWALRALLALMAGNTQIPDGFEQLGMAGMAQLGLRGLQGLRHDVAAPLLAEMMECIQRMPSPAKPNILRPLIEEDIEEVTTRVNLKIEVFKLHTAFLKAGALSLSKGDPAAVNPANSQNI